MDFLREDQVLPTNSRRRGSGTAVYVIGFAASFWLPEPKADRLQD
jgi:hypothetical protein